MFFFSAIVAGLIAFDVPHYRQCVTITTMIGFVFFSLHSPGTLVQKLGIILPIWFTINEILSHDQKEANNQNQ